MMIYMIVVRGNLSKISRTQSRTGFESESTMRRSQFFVAVASHDPGHEWYDVSCDTHERNPEKT